MRGMRERFLMVALVVVGVVGIGGRALAEARLGYLTLEKEYPERLEMAPGILGGEGEHTLRDLIATLDDVATRKDLSGLVLRLKDPKLKGTQIEEIGRAMERVRKSGKKVHVFSETYGTGAVLLGCHADEMILQDGGVVSVPGISMQEMFLKDTLNWIGIQPDFVQIGAYKGAEEMFARSSPSPEWDQNISGVLDSMYEDMLSTIMKGRHMSHDEAESALGQCFWANGSRAMMAGMIDAEVDRMDLDAHLEKEYGDTVSLVNDLWVTSGPAAPDLTKMGMFQAFGELMKALSEGGKRQVSRDTIALLYIDGMIVDGESERSLLGGSTSVGDLTIRKALKEIETNPLIKGLVVRIDSPGGSAVASEIIWQGLKRVSAAGKPVWVSVGSLAASGGYYCAVAGDKIYVNPGSIVGSIGVVGGKLAMDGLYTKLKANVIQRTRGPRADMMGSLHVWTPDERALIQQRMTETYNQFASRVKSGRRGIDLSKTAEGRLFVGQDAVDMKMADGVEGIEQVISGMADSLSLAEGAYDVLDYPAPKSLEELIQEMLGKGSNASARAPEGAFAAAGRAALGDEVWSQVSWGVEAVLEMRHRPVMLVMPRVLMWKW